eukprot:s4766_g1.t1
MAAVLQLALLMATSVPVLATECLMIGKVYEDKPMHSQVKLARECLKEICILYSCGFSKLAIVFYLDVLHEFLQEASKQKKENVHKWEDCARSCNQTDGCSLFTYQPESVFKSNCWLIKVSRLSKHIFAQFALVGRCVKISLPFF